MRHVTFEVPGKARGKQRPRATRQGRVYTPSQTVNAEAYVKMLATQAMAGKPPFEGPLYATFVVVVGVPASWNKKRTDSALKNEIRPTGKPDLDNIVKLLADAMNGIVYKDDKQIVSLTIRKIYGEVESTAIYVRDIGDIENDAAAFIQAQKLEKQRTLE